MWGFDSWLLINCVMYNKYLKSNKDKKHNRQDVLSSTTRLEGSATKITKQSTNGWWRGCVRRVMDVRAMAWLRHQRASTRLRHWHMTFEQEKETHRSWDAVSETLCPIPQRRMLNMSAATLGFLNNLQKTKNAATTTPDASLPSYIQQNNDSHYINRRFQRISEVKRVIWYCIEPLDSSACTFKQKEIWMQGLMQ